MVRAPHWNSRLPRPGRSSPTTASTSNSAPHSEPWHRPRRGRHARRHRPVYCRFQLRGEAPGSSSPTLPRTGTVVTCNGPPRPDPLDRYRGRILSPPPASAAIAPGSRPRRCIRPSASTPRLLLRPHRHLDRTLPRRLRLVCLQPRRPQLDHHADQRQRSRRPVPLPLPALRSARPPARSRRGPPLPPMRADFPLTLDLSAGRDGNLYVRTNSPAVSGTWPHGTSLATSHPLVLGDL